jgi:hypothetical protein
MSLRPPLRAAALALVATLILAVPAATADARRAPQGFYGVMWDGKITATDYSEQVRNWDLMAAAGVESTRAFVPWSNAQPAADGVTDYGLTDRLVTLATTHHIRLLPAIWGTPDWAASNPEVTGSPPEHVSDYAAYLRLLVIRYGPHGTLWDEHPELPRRPIREWQIWNEPHFNVYWNTEGHRRNSWAPGYARLLRAANRAIKSVDPKATTVLAGLADYAWKHVTLLSKYRIQRSFDVAAVNLFTSRPKLVMKGLRYVRHSMRRGGVPRKPIWLTEATWPAGKGRVAVPAVAWQRGWYTTDAGMARRLRALYATAIRNRRKLRLQRVYWYTWASGYHGDDLFDYTGLAQYVDGQTAAVKPSFAAYTASARRFEGCHKTITGFCR